MSSTHGSPVVARAGEAVRAALPLATDRCTLREVRPGDAEALLAYRSRPEVTRFLGHPPLDADEVAALLRGWRDDPAAVSVAVELRETTHHEGAAGVSGGLVPGIVGDIRVRFRPSSAMAPATTDAVEAAIGYAFHPGVQGVGLATECVRAVLGLTLGAAGARRVTARVFAPAAPSSRLLARLGFTRDGVDRAAVLAPDGTAWWDDELWSLLPHEGRMP